MRQVPNYGDTRQTAACAYCFDATQTRDHVPCRVLLDEPFPDNLPVVPSCLNCNNTASADEEYLACLLECVVSGSTEPSQIGREKISRLLIERPALRERLAAAHRREGERSIFGVEMDRIERIIVKLARGHALYELNEPQLSPPSTVRVTPVHLLSDEARTAFENTAGDGFAVWPEVGSRAMQRLVESGEGWISVQDDRYRYIATADSMVCVRIVLSEYLACEVTWQEAESIG